MKTETVYIKRLCSQPPKHFETYFLTNNGHCKYDVSIWLDENGDVTMPVWWLEPVDRVVMTEEELHDLVGFTMHTTVGFLNDPTKGEIFAENVYDLYLKSKEA